MSNSSYPPKRVWRLWKVTPPQLTTEQAVGYTLQNVVTLEERLAQHSLNFLQLSRKGKLAEDKVLESYLKGIEDRYQAGMKALESEFHTRLEAQAEALESQNEIILALEAEVEALRQAPPEPEEMAVWDVISQVENGFRAFFEGIQCFRIAIQMIVKNRPQPPEAEEGDQDKFRQ